jgi:hypothetical protein
MRNAGVFSLVLLLAMSVAVAQQAPTEHPGHSGEQPYAVDTERQEQTLRGCLVRENGEFAFKDETGDRYRVEGEEQQLSAHVDHYVELRGNVQREEADFEAREGVADPEVRDEEFVGTIEVNEFTHIDNNCPQDTAAAHEGEAIADPMHADPMTEEQAATETEGTDTMATETEQDTFATDTRDQWAATEQEQQVEDPAIAQAPPADPAFPAQEDDPAIARDDTAIVAEDDATLATETEGQQWAQETEPVLDADTEDQQTVAQWDDQDMLPQTASPLPLLMLLGFGAFLAGLIARRK